MDKRKYGPSFSKLIIGTMRLGEWGVKMTTDELADFVAGCMDLGLVDFDHADIYGHYTEEAAFGKVLKRYPEWRKKMRLTTKCGIKMESPNRPTHRIKSYDSGKAHIIASAENSLKELQTDYIDLLLLHRPDYLMDPQQVAEAFEQLKNEGKVLAFGVSNFSTSQVRMLQQYTSLVNHQMEISLLHLAPFNNGLLDQCLEHQITPTAWSPLGGGALFSESTNPTHIRLQKVGNEIAEQHGVGLDQILLSFLLKHPAGIIPVLGTSNLKRVNSALNAYSITLGKEDWYRLWKAATGEELP